MTAMRDGANTSRAGQTEAVTMHSPDDGDEGEQQIWTERVCQLFIMNGPVAI